MSTEYAPINPISSSDQSRNAVSSARHWGRILVGSFLVLSLFGIIGIYYIPATASKSPIHPLPYLAAPVYPKIHSYRDQCECSQLPKVATCCLITDINRVRYKINDCACTCGRGTIQPLEKCAHLPPPSVPFPSPTPPPSPCILSFPFVDMEQPSPNNMVSQASCGCSLEGREQMTATNSFMLTSQGVSREEVETCMEKHDGLLNACEEGEKASFEEAAGTAFKECCTEIGGDSSSMFRCKPFLENEPWDVLPLETEGCKMDFIRYDIGFYARCGCSGEDKTTSRRRDGVLQLIDEVDETCISDCIERQKETVHCPYDSDTSIAGTAIKAIMNSCCEECGHTLIGDQFCGTYLGE